MAMTNEVGRNAKKRDNTNFFIRVLKFIIPWKGDKLPDILRKLVFIVALVAFIIAGAMLIEYQFGSDKEDKLQSSLIDLISDESRDTSSSVPVSDGSSEYTEPQILDKYTALLELNPDTIGMVKIPGLVDSDGVAYIEYPIVQTTDNTFYVDHDFEKNSSAAGWIFADFKIPITATNQADNITLYGHNMKSGKMFRHLNDYKGGYGSYSSEYNPTAGLEVLKDANLVQFDTLWKESDYVIFAVFTVGTKAEHDNGDLFEYYKVRGIATEEEFDYFYENVMKRSLFLSDIEVEYGEDLLTLSTCNSAFDDSRTVVVCRKLRDGETAEQYIDTYKVNPDPWLPYRLYEVYGSWFGTPNH